MEKAKAPAKADMVDEAPASASDQPAEQAQPEKDAAPVAATVEETPAAAASDEDPVVSTCVVNGGRGLHVGQAVNGKVCSYHAMHYDPQGNRR